MAAAPLRRRAARVLLLDPAGRLLLVCGADPATPGRRFWWTVGGGLEPGEGPAEAAVREVLEETGLVVPEAALIGPVGADQAAFAFGDRWIEQENDYFVARVPAGAEPRVGHRPAEVADLLGCAWWTPAQLQAQLAGHPNDGPGRPGEAVYPAELADVYRAALAAVAGR